MTRPAIYIFSMLPSLLLASTCEIIFDVESVEWPHKHTLTTDEQQPRELMIYETKRVFRPKTVTCEGIRVLSEKRVGFYNTIDGHGHATTYSTFSLANGDSIFATTDTAVTIDKYGASEADGAVVITGGTGKYVNISGHGKIKRRFKQQKLYPAYQVLSYQLPRNTVR